MWATIFGIFFLLALISTGIFVFLFIQSKAKILTVTTTLATVQQQLGTTSSQLKITQDELAKCTTPVPPATSGTESFYVY